MATHSCLCMLLPNAAHDYLLTNTASPLLGWGVTISSSSCGLSTSFPTMTEYINNLLCTSLHVLFTQVIILHTHDSWKLLLLKREIELCFPCVLLSHGTVCDENLAAICCRAFFNLISDWMAWHSVVRPCSSDISLLMTVYSASCLIWHICIHVYMGK